MEATQLVELNHRTDIIARALMAEESHFQTERETHMNQTMKKHLTEQINFYQKIVNKLQEALLAYESWFSFDCLDVSLPMNSVEINCYFHTQLFTSNCFCMRKEDGSCKFYFIVYNESYNGMNLANQKIGFFVVTMKFVQFLISFEFYVNDSD